MRVTITGVQPRRPSPAARNFARDLLMTKDLSRLPANADLFPNSIDARRDAVLAMLTEDADPYMTAEQCSKLIDKLKPLPRKGSAAATGDEPWRAVPTVDAGDNPGLAMQCTSDRLMLVPAGKYAIETGTLSGTWQNEVAFFNVWCHEDGRWSVKHFASDELLPLPRKVQYEVLATIGAEGPAIASARYGRLSVRCGVCGRKLTKDESRAAGIGPICADRMGW